MYCSACGVAVISGLSYCNHCGARLREPSDPVKSGEMKTSETFSESLVWAMVAVFAIGIGCTIGLMAVMKNVLDFPREWILAVVGLSFSLIFILESIFIWLLLSSRRAPGRRDAPEKTAGDSTGISSRVTAADLETNELYAPPAAAGALPETRDVPSVVDHTTRDLEPVLAKREKK